MKQNGPQRRAMPALIFTAVMGLSPLLAAPAAGQTPAEADVGSAAATALRPGAGAVPRPSVSPTRTETPPEIDGRLDEPVWANAARLTGFTQQQPLDGAPATEETEVWVAYDSDYLYFAFYAHYEDPSIMRANRVDRDRAFPDDLFTIYLDTYGDQQWAYDFDVNPYGVQGDGIIRAGSNGPIPRADRTWNGLFRTGAQIVEDGYTAEMAIPFKTLRYPALPEGEPHHWGFQMIREVKSKNEENIVWAPMSRDEASFFAQMGTLDGMTNLSRSRNIEILPTFTAIQYGSLDPASAVFDNARTDPDAGVNVKYGITSNLTADFTINPDFSQIESDQAEIEVNQRFPIFFPELRPFFLEGAEIFDVPGPVTLVHTRTIVDPDYGAKLSGKIGNAAVGIVAANDRAPGNLDDQLDPAYGENASTVIARARYDLYTESNVAATVTDREFLDSYSRLAGVDGNFRLTPNVAWDFRLFNAWHRDLDQQENEGHVYATRLVRAGRHLDLSGAAYQVSPDFQTDVGFVRRVDQRVMQGTANYRFWPQSWIINWGPTLEYSRNWDYDSQLQDEELYGGVSFSFNRNISLSGGIRQTMERYRDVDFDKTRFSVRGNINTSRRWSVGGSYNRGDEIRYVASPFLGTGSQWGMNLTLRPVSRLETRFNLNSSRLEEPVNGDEVFDVKILRSYTTFQFTDRLSARNITEYNSYDRKLGLNVLLNYRVNAGTVFFVGYDDHLQHADLIEDLVIGDPRNDHLFLPDQLWRTQRALFMKLQYLIRW